jgi:hypothetical protein
MAIAGETQCAEVGACDDEVSWEAILSAPNALHVSAAYAGNEHDGSREHPYVTIGEAVAVAPAGSSVAIEDGQYVEALTIERSLRIFGHCPARVAVIGNTAPAITVTAGGTELDGLALSGHAGVHTELATNVTLRRLWIHDTSGSAVVVYGGDARFEHGLIERINGGGVVAIASSVEVVDSTMRDLSASDTTSAVTAHITTPTDPRPHIAVRGTLIERVAGFGLLVIGGDATVERSVVRDMRGDTQQKYGDGIAVNSFSFSPPTVPSRADVRETWIQHNERAGIAAFGANMSLSRVVLDCNTIDLAAEPAPVDPTLGSELENLGSNACGCAPLLDQCQARSANLEPPLAL